MNGSVKFSESSVNTSLSHSHRPCLRQNASTEKHSSNVRNRTKSHPPYPLEFSGEITTSCASYVRTASASVRIICDWRQTDKHARVCPFLRTSDSVVAFVRGVSTCFTASSRLGEVPSQPESVSVFSRLTPSWSQHQAQCWKAWRAAFCSSVQVHPTAFILPAAQCGGAPPPPELPEPPSELCDAILRQASGVCHGRLVLPSRLACPAGNRLNESTGPIHAE